MTSTWTPVITAAGTVVGALTGGILGGVISRRHEARRWTRDQRMSAYADLVRSYTAVYHCLASLDEHGRRGTPDWPDWTRALAVVYMIGDDRIADRARAIDAALWAVSLRVKNAGQLPGDEWRALRAPAEANVLAFLNLARADVGTRGEPLPALLGRPDGYPPG